MTPGQCSLGGVSGADRASEYLIRR